MLFACPIFVLVLMFVFPRLNSENAARYVIIGFLGVAAWCGYQLLLILALQEHPPPTCGEVARAVFDRVFRGVRRGDLGRFVGIAVARTLFGWLIPRRISVAALLLGDNVAFDSRFPVPLRAVQRVRFAPDPAEDYAECERPAQYCAAAVELVMGREFRLILDQADADRLRRWAATKAIPVCDENGYIPRLPEPASEVPVHE
jgi:hypothetical protein